MPAALADQLVTCPVLLEDYSMVTFRFALPACAVLALSLAACGGSAQDETIAADQAREQVRKEAEAMARAADGSAAKAVGDMMSDPEVQAQLGMTSPVAPPTAAATPASDLDLTEVANSGWQAQALASCRALKAMRTGGARAASDAELARARQEIIGNPNALATCQTDL